MRCTSNPSCRKVAICICTVRTQNELCCATISSLRRTSIVSSGESREFYRNTCFFSAPLPSPLENLWFRQATIFEGTFLQRKSKKVDNFVSITKETVNRNPTFPTVNFLLVFPILDGFRGIATQSADFWHYIRAHACRFIYKLQSRDVRSLWSSTTCLHEFIRHFPRTSGHAACLCILCRRNYVCETPYPLNSTSVTFPLA